MKVIGSNVDAQSKSEHLNEMKSHLFISAGLLLAAIFVMRGLEALNAPGFGLREIYILGGFLIAGCLVHAGWKERKAK